MASVGTAYVTIRVNTKGFEAQLDKMMARLSKKMESHGNNLGKSFSKGMKDAGLDSLFDDFADSAENASRRAADSLDRVGQSMDRNRTKSNQFAEDMIDGMDAAGEAARNARKDVDDLGRGLNDASKNARGLGGSMNGIGNGGNGLRRAGDDAGFFSNMMRSLSQSAEAGAATLHGLYDAEAFLGTAMAALVSAASAAVQGIGALAAEALAAAPALGVLATAGIGLAQVGGTIALSMGGVGNAIKAGLAPARTSASGIADATKGISSSVAAALRSVRDAKQGLATAYQSAARAAEDSARRIADAERSVGDAQRAVAAAQAGVRNAQLALNAARKEGLEQLEDIAFAAEDADLAQQRAALNLEDAYNALQEAQSLPPDDRARREAELAYKEAELQLREAKDRREDADKEQKHAAKTGVRGTEAMQTAYANLASAQDTLRDSQQSLADAQRNLAEAHQQAARSEEDSARRIRDAQESLADAQARLKQARDQAAKSTSSAATAEDKFREAMEKLAPAQRIFVNNIIANKNRFLDFRKAVAQPVFLGINSAFDDLLNKRGPQQLSLLDRLQEQFVGTGQVLGDFIAKEGELAASDVFSSRLTATMATNNEAMGHFGGALDNLIRLFNNVAFAARPLILELSKYVEQVTQGWWETRHTGEQLSDMSVRFQQAAERAKELWRFFGALWRVTATLGRAAALATESYQGLSGEVKESGRTVGFIPRMTKALDTFDDKLNRPRNFRKLVKGFGQALQTMEATAKAAKNAILDPLIAMGQDPAVEKAMGKFANTDVFDRLAAAANDAAPELADLAVSIAEILANMAESGSIKRFLHNIGIAADLAAKFTGVLADHGILRWLGYITAGAATFRVLSSVVKIALSPMILMGKRIGTLSGQFSRFVNGAPTQPTSFSAKWRRSFTNMSRTASNSFTSIRNGFAKLVNKLTLGRVDMGLRDKKELLPKPDAQPPTADAGDKAKAEQAGKSIAQAYADGLKAGKAQIDAAIEALEANVTAKLTAMSATLEPKALTNGTELVAEYAKGIRSGLPAKDRAMDALRNNVDGMLTKMRGVVEPKALADGLALVSKYAQGILDGATTELSAGFTLFQDEVVVKLATLGTTLQAKAVSTGAQIVAGLVEGLNAAKVEGITVAEAVGRAIAQAVNSGAGVHSPSTITIKGGLELDRGAIVGIQEGLAVAQTEAEVAGAKIGGSMTAGFRASTAGMKAAGAAAAVAPATGAVGAAGAAAAAGPAAALGAGPAPAAVGKFAKFGKILGPLTKLAKPLSVGMKLIGGAFSLMLGPVGMIVLTLLPFLMPLLKKLNDKFHITEKVASAVGWAFGKLADGAKWTFDQIMKVAGPVLDWFGDHWGSIKDTLTAPFEAIGGFVSDHLGDVTGAITGVIGFIRDHWKLILAILAGPFGLVVYAVVKNFGKIRGAVSGVIDWIKGHWKLILAILTGPFGLLIYAVTKNFDKIRGFVSGLIDWVRDHWKSVLGFFVSPIATAVTQVRTHFDKIKEFVGNLISRFRDIPDAVGRAFDNLGGFAKGGINSFIGFLNDNLIDTINSVTSKFGLTINPIPRLATGGKVDDAMGGGRVRGPGGSRDDKVLAAVSPHEFVVKASSSRKIGYDRLAYINRTGQLPPHGGLRDKIGGFVGGVAHGALDFGGAVISGIGDIGKAVAKKGLGKVLEEIIKGVTALMSGAGIRRGTFLTDLFYGVMDKLASLAKDWGGEEGMGASGGLGKAMLPTAARKQVSGAVEGKWTYPLAKRYQGYNYAGHKPSWAYDIAAPIGTGVKAASSGVVRGTYNMGKGGYGKYMVVDHSGASTLYAHLASFNATAGQIVRVGQRIARSGNTGSVSGANKGAHLHFEALGSRDTEDFLRRMGVKLATGGVVKATDGGVLSVIAEAGRSERVEPLDAQGMSKRDHVLLEMIKALIENAQGGDTWNIHPAPGMSELEFSKQVRREVIFHRRRGA